MLHIDALGEQERSTHIISKGYLKNLILDFTHHTCSNIHTLQYLRIVVGVDTFFILHEAMCVIRNLNFASVQNILGVARDAWHALTRYDVLNIAVKHSTANIIYVKTNSEA